MNLSSFASENGELRVLASGNDGFHPRRVFTVTANAGDLRGQHAHRRCSQLLVCVRGEIKVGIRDLDEIDYRALRPDGTALLVPPMTWGLQEFRRDESIMIVLADCEYDESQYIRDWDEFVSLITSRGGI